MNHHLRNDCLLLHPVHTQIRAIGPRFLHHTKGRGPTGRLPHGKPLPPRRGPLPKDADEKTRMARKLRSKQGSAIYAQRKAIVEQVNDQIKEARGLRRFLLRGLEKVDG